MLKMMAGINIVHVAYKGAGIAATDLAGCDSK
jgi:tripartite-type tricarboxylate transporter receptor subunit TctC